MVKVATCFSGIGAVEHALNRMGIDNTIVFACDNGDVDILSTKIELDMEVVEKEFRILTEKIELLDESEYRNELCEELLRDKKLLKDRKKELEAVDLQMSTALCHVFSSVKSMDGVKSNRKMEYQFFSECFASKRKQKENNRLYLLFYSIEILNDFHKDNDWNTLDQITDYKSKDGIEWAMVKSDVVALKDMIDCINGRRIIKSIRDICERLGMLHEKIATLEIHKQLEMKNSYDEKKAYVDSLYQGKEDQNKVKQSYMANYELSERHFHWNVLFLDGKEYKNQVDLLVGGSPCQSFSLVGKQRGLEDTRGTLFYEYARLINEIRPKVFIYENVKAILSNDDGRTWDTISRVFTSLEYIWDWDILNARDFGIPQNRERVFAVGFRKDLTLAKKFQFPTPIPLTTTMKDFLMDNVSGKYYLPKKGVDFVTSDKNLTKRYTQIDGEVALCQKKNQQFNWHGDFVFVDENNDKEKTMQDLEKYFLSEKVKKYVLSTGTKGFYSRPETDLDIARPLLTTMHKMHRSGVDNYVTTEGRLRKLTPRECLRLMGFSDSFQIVVSDTAMYQQSGNSIVVDVLMNIIDKIIETYPNLIKE